MTTIIAVHEVENGEHWAKAWHHGAGSRHELVAKMGGTARTFGALHAPNSVVTCLFIVSVNIAPSAHTARGSTLTVSCFASHTSQ